MKVTFADQEIYEMTPFRRFRYGGKEYALFLFGEENDPVLVQENDGIFYPAPEEIITELLPDLSAMLDGFSPFSVDNDKITILE